MDDGNVKCWGYNDYGQLGYEDTIARGTQEREMGDWLQDVNLGGGTVVEVDAGRYHSCARFLDGRVKCWGYNGNGQLGYGNTTQLGDVVGEMGTALPYVNLGTGRTAVSLQTGEYHTCAALDNGAVKCWGAAIGLGIDGTVQRGDGANEMGDNLPAVNIPGAPAIDTIAMGGDLSCGISTCGDVYCWGTNAYGQTGIGTSTTTATPVARVNYGTGRYVPTRSGTSCNVNQRPAAPGVTFARVGPSTAFDLQCTVSTEAPDPDGDFITYTVAWKKDGVTWAGATSTTTIAGDTIAAADVGTGLWTCTVTPNDGVGAGTAKTESHLVRPFQRDLTDASGEHTCVVNDDGTLRCWGRNNVGQVGVGSTVNIGDAAAELGNALAAVNLGAGRTAVEVATGTTHTCALLDNGAVRCWGSQTYGEIGTGGTVTIGDQANEVGNDGVDPVVNLGAGRTAVTIDAGDGFTCAILDDGRVKCWGNSAGDRLGFTPATNRGRDNALMGDNLPAVDLGVGRKAIDLSTGFGHTCALLDNGDVKCWGFNNYGQLGQGDTVGRGSAVREMGDYLRPIALGGGIVVDVGAGYDHSCVLFIDGKVKCWGRNDSGQLGYGNTTQLGDASSEMGASLPFVNLGTGRTAVALRVGAYHTCAQLDNSTIKCWGYSQGAGWRGLPGAARRRRQRDGRQPSGDRAAGRRAGRPPQRRRQPLLRGHHLRRDVLLGPEHLR
jgi:alpha-tubulin suppressor-like RCC1 family protein